MSSSTKRIAVVIPKYGLVGGGERFASEVTERIASNPDYDIHVFANRWRALSDRITFHHVPIIRFPRFLTTISFAYYANRLMRDMPFDLVHAHDRIFRADLFTMHGVPHRYWVKEVRAKRMSLFDYGTAWVEKKLVESGGCRKFLAVSQLAGEIFLGQYPVDRPRVEVVHPGVSLDRFDLSLKDSARSEVRQRYRIPPDAPIVLFVSMNFELKGLARIMAALARLKQGGPATVPPALLVAGKGNQRKFGRMAAELGIGDRVVFAGVVEEEVEKLYLAADVFAMLSDFDTFGMAVLEAMAAGVPVVISDRVGAGDIVSHGVNGFVVNRHDVDLLARQFAAALEPGVRNRMGEAARRSAEGHDWSAVADRVEALYRSLMTH